jgi:deazaflavin-dependent oxidoreductase (nitroreductase family)
VPKPPPSSSRIWKLVNAGTALNVVVYRLSGGRVGGRIQKARVLLLHHVGRKSGDERVTPLLYLPDGDDLVVVASKGGTDRHPAWFHNLMAGPETSVEVGRDRRPVRAREANDAERAQLWPRLVEVYSPYESYQRYAGERRIPVVVLEPA